MARSLPFAAASRIGIAGGNRAAEHAGHWLRLLGAVPSEADANSEIVITAGVLDADAALTFPSARCIIRVWDFQVGHAGNGLFACAASGAASVIGYADGPGTGLPAEMPEKWCGAFGVILALAELWREGSDTALAPVIHDISAADILRSFSLQNAGTREEMLHGWRRNGRICFEHGGIFPMGFFACKDGHVAILGRSRRDWRNIRQAIGDPEWARDEAYENPFTVARESATADRLLEETLAAFSRDELLERGLAAEAVIAPVFTQEEAAARGVFREHFITSDGPAMPFVADPLGQAAAPRDRSVAAPTAATPLAGLRVIELCWVWSGPMVCQILADLGAEVIKVEAPKRFDLYRTRGFEARRGEMAEEVRIESSYQFHSLNRNKSGLTLDLKHDEGREVMADLVASSDLLVENFTVGTMDRLGLGAEMLRTANPALVQLSMSGPGRGSSVEALRSYGLVLSALGGAETRITDDKGFLGSPIFSISDPNAATFGVMTALAGASAARESGRGSVIDLSQIEAAATLAGSPVAEPETHTAIVVTAEGGHAAVSLPIAADLDLNTLSGLELAEIVVLCKAAGGATVMLEELGHTDDAPWFADCSGFVEAHHPVTGAEMLVASPWRTNGARPGVRKSAPMLGREDEHVLRGVLGLDDDRIKALKAAHVVGVPPKDDKDQNDKK